MNSLNLITACAFACAFVLGVMLITLQDIRSQRPEARIKTRVLETFAGQAGAGVQVEGNAAESLFTVGQRESAFDRWFGPRIARIKTVAEANGMRLVIGSGVAGLLAALVMTRLMPLPDFSKPLLILGLPVLAVVQMYRFLVARFRRRFLDGFPDVIDMVVRAVRAGVPVTHVMGSAAEECEEPLRTEFRLMGDALKLGIDFEEVLGAAARRIEVTDFSFFCVCLLLQRDTGGQLGETLENLAQIVRTRREIRLKIKALTGEARITTKILAALPVINVLGLYAVNRDYVMVLFTDPTGHKLLTFAVISVVTGIAVINRIAKLNTSR
jgi:tight adherence protein B